MSQCSCATHNSCFFSGTVDLQKSQKNSNLGFAASPLAARRTPPPPPRRHLVTPHFSQGRKVKQSLLLFMKFHFTLSSKFTWTCTGFRDWGKGFFHTKVWGKGKMLSRHFQRGHNKLWQGATSFQQRCNKFWYWWPYISWARFPINIDRSLTTNGPMDQSNVSIYRTQNSGSWSVHIRS